MVSGWIIQLAFLSLSGKSSIQLDSKNYYLVHPYWHLIDNASVVDSLCKSVLTIKFD